MVTEREPLVVVLLEPVWHVHAEALVQTLQPRGGGGADRSAHRSIRSQLSRDACENEDDYTIC